jgi:DHA1 family multidrug resistance protein-like MFS transporter
MRADTRAEQRRILIWMCVFIGLNQGGFGAIIPVLPLYAQAFGVPASAIGSTIAIYGLARMLSAMPGGRFSDRLGRRPSMAIGGAICALGNLWCALAGSFPEFVVARFVAGLGAGWVQVVGQVVLADISTPSERGRMLSIYQGVFLCAVGVGPLPGGLLAEHFGLAAPFAVYAVATGGAAVLAWFVVPETRAFAIGGKPAALPPTVPFALQMRALVSHTGFALVCLVGLINAVVRTGGLFGVVPVLAVTKLDLGPGVVGAALAVGSVLGLLASYPAGWLADRHGRKPIIVPSALATAGAFLVFCAAPSFFWFGVACVIWGVASAVNGAAPAAYAADNAQPGMNAAAMSAYRMLSDVGYVIGPIGLGLVVDGFGAEAALAVAAVLVGGVGLLFARYAPETWPRPTGR